MKLTRLLERWLTLWVFCSLAATALIYPICLNRHWFSALMGRFYVKGGAWIEFFESTIRPALQFGYDPLILKETAGALCVLLLVVGYLPWKLACGPVRRQKPWLHLPLLGALLVAVTSLLWAPAPRISILTLEALLPCAILYLVVSDLHWGERGRRRLLGVIAVIGAIVALGALFQRTPILERVFHLFFFKFTAAQHPRNVVGSLIGHNSEMSSYALSGLLAALALALTTRRMWVRVALGAAITLELYVIIAGQSRSIWPLTLLLGALGLHAMSRELGRRPRLWHYLAPLALIALLAIPLASQVKRRLADFGLDAMRRETRLRIAVAVLPRVVDTPRDALFGHGIGSFISVYPRMQADYFTRFPETFVEPTALRTPQAHNDYIQALVEIGIVGTALLFLALLAYVRAGETGRQALPSSRDRAQSLVFGLIAAQHLLNALVNFPAHVPPPAYLFAVSLGAWTALGREGRRPEECRAYQPGGRSAAGRILLLCAALAPIAAAPMAWTRLIREAVVSSHSQIAEGWMNNVYAESGASREEQAQAINEAERHLRQALRLDPLNYWINFHMQRLYLQIGRGSLDELRRAEAALSALETPNALQQRQVAQLRLAATRNLQLSLRYGESSMDEVTYHENLYRASQAYEMLNQLHPGEEYKRRQLELLLAAVRHSGVYYDALRDLSRFYSTPGNPPPPDRRFMERLHKGMRTGNPRQYIHDFIMPAHHNIYRLEFHEAMMRSATLIPINPEREDLRLILVRALIELGQLAQAEQSLELLRRDFPESPAFWNGRTRLLIAQGREVEALETALAHAAADPALGGAASLLLKRQGREDEAEQAWRAAASTPELEMSLRIDRAYTAWTYFRDTNRALEDLDILLAGDRPPGLACYVRAQIALEEGDSDAAVDFARRAIENGMNSDAGRILLRRALELRESDPGA